jgi:archaellum component FlaF (FlaF/FlaG flagellin family)
MSGGGVGLGAVYSPLPQSISDTESTEEELNSTVHRSNNRKFVVTNKDSVDKRKGI